MAGYLTPDVLVDTQWCDQHKNDPNLRVVECDSDPTLFSQGHIPGAVRLDCQTELVDRNTRDLITVDEFQKLAGRLGINNTTEILFYGDQYNIQACYAYWVFRMFGHEKLRVLNGGRDKFVADGHKLTRETTNVPQERYKAKPMAKQFRALREDVLHHIGSPDPRTPKVRMEGRALLDDRTQPEFEGVFAQDAGYPPRFLRGGHIPGAANVPWNELLNTDGTFRSANEIKTILTKKGITQDKDVVVYTRIGERASLMWFVLHELLSYPKVRTYDGSWTEWGNTVGMPIENGSIVAVPVQHGRTKTGSQTTMSVG